MKAVVIGEPSGASMERILAVLRGTRLYVIRDWNDNLLVE